MEIQKIDGTMLRKMFEFGAQNLETYKSNVDELNVFPVPDGDTGTNMSMTFANSIRELDKLKNDELYAVSKTASSGALFGARGNSGVILSQLLRGLAKANKGKQVLDIKAAADGIKAAADTAYKAVMKPTEGTILTVAREMSEFAQAHYTEYTDMLAFLTDVLKQGQDALSRTPDMLPVLKEAGVVDSGGQGLIYIVEGAVKGLAGEEIPLAGRICSIADVLDALSSPRCYKQPWPEEKVKDEFLKQRGGQFQPELVDVLMEHWDEIYSHYRR